MNLFETHRTRFEQARETCRTRVCWSPFPEMPGKYPDAERARAAGQQAFEGYLARPFPLELPGCQPGSAGVGQEVSPYTGQRLGITYPQAALDALFEAAEAAMTQGWESADPETRIGLLLEVIERLFQRMFEVSFAVMHTSGQSFNMSYAGSGVNALDRGIEALVYAHEAMAGVARQATWQRSFGSATIALDKTYRLVPRGVAVCFTCASFPTWNAWPSMMASLATGNAVIVKPHPATVLPMAISVEVFRTTLKEFGFDPNLVTMAVDTFEAPIGKTIVKHPRAAIIDFTGSVGFGQWVEKNAHPALAFTETAGLNTVVIESCDDLPAVLRSLATTLCMFSAQMCTSPQNIYLPASGVRVGRGAAAHTVAAEAVASQLASAVAALVEDPRKAAMILATIQSGQSLRLIDRLRDEGRQRGRVLLDSHAYVHPEFPQARTATPMMLGVTPDERDLYCEERFGPISFCITTADADDALRQATRDVKQHGGLTAFLYSTDDEFIARAEAAYARAGAQLTINLTGPMPLNFAAAYSDYHVTGLNPAGNAALTDAAFVASRFRIAQSRRPANP